MSKIFSEQQYSSFPVYEADMIKEKQQTIGYSTNIINYGINTIVSANND